MPPLLADFSHARPCKLFCEKSLTLPIGAADRPRLSHTQNRMPFGIGRELFIAEKIKL